MIYQFFFSVLDDLKMRLMFQISQSYNNWIWETLVKINLSPLTPCLINSICVSLFYNDCCS